MIVISGTRLLFEMTLSVVFGKLNTHVFRADTDVLEGPSFFQIYSHRLDTNQLSCSFVVLCYTVIYILDKAGTITLLIQRLVSIVLTVFKSLHVLNTTCLVDAFTPKYVPYQLPDSNLSEQFRCRTTILGVQTTHISVPNFGMFYSIILDKRLLIAD